MLVQQCRPADGAAAVVPEHDPAALGITDEVFKPLVEAGQLVSRWQDARYRTVREVRGTVRPRGPEKLAEKARGGDAGGDVSHAEPEGMAGRPAEGPCEWLYDFRITDAHELLAGLGHEIDVLTHKDADLERAV